MKQGQFPAILPLASLDGQNGFKIDGEMSGDHSGGSVSTAGDVNGDGYADLLIGASGYANNTGRSYVVFGGPTVGAGGTIALSSLNGTNGFKLDGEVIGDYSGISVSTTGDINGDGHADLLIGAYFHANAMGRSYVVFGAMNVGTGGRISLSNLNGTNGFKLDGELSGDQSGISVSGAVDFNSDGHADLVIGAIGYPSSAGMGRSYIIFGGPNIGGGGVIPLSTLNGTNGIKFDGETSDDYSGNSVSAGGDINGDGRADLLISSPNHATQTGRSYVAFGGLNVGSGGSFLLSSLNGTNGFKLDGETSGDYGGYPVSAVGDINSDGYADLMFGAFGHANGTGRGYVVFGGSSVGVGGIISLSNLDGTNGFKLDGEATGDHAGASISGVADINGDGISDLLIGADPAFSTGRSYVVFGGPRVGNAGLFSLANLNGQNGFKLSSEVTGDHCGYSSSTAGDVNGDGIADLIIGAYNHNGGIGRSYVVFGDVPPVLVNNSLSLSVGAAIQLNSADLSAYDRNHNNNSLVFIPDGISHGQFETVGVPGIALTNFTQQQISSGVIQFVHDGTLVAPSYNITVRSDGIAWAGSSPAKINFIGAPQSHFPAIIPLAGLNGQNGFKIDGEASGDYSGQWVGLGDINADGYIDLLIGAFGFNNYVGRSYVLFGKPGIGSSGLISLSNLNGTINRFKFDGESGGYFSGISLNMGGDVNRDGYADLLIGAYSAMPGRSYLFFGGPQVGNGSIFSLSNLNGTNGFKIFGEATTDRSGYPVSIDDINGDGVADLIIGAIGYNSNTGRNYVVFGGSGIGSSGSISLSTLNGVNGFKIDGEAVNDILVGGSLSSVGDINGDGYTDLIMGVDNYNNMGRSYVIFGGPGIGSSGLISLSTLNGINGFKLNAEAVNDGCGWATAAAGDINADGYADLIVGCAGHNNGTGRSHVVFGGPGIGSSGSLSLSSLNGTDGFKIDGETISNSGHSVHAAGDMNGDGYADLSIGAFAYNNLTGRTYIVFGGPEVGKNGILLLSSINGDNGFKLDGEAASDFLNYVSSSAGDINGDGITDLLVGAHGHASNTGRTYVVFGDAPPTLVQNQLSLYPGETVHLNVGFLSAYDRNHNNNSLVFFPTNVTHGQFESISQSGVPLINFTQPQLLNDTIQFVHDGSSFAPSYNMTVYSAGIAWTGPAAANITFFPATSIPVITTTTIPTTVTPTPTLTPTFTSTPTTTSIPVTTSAPSLTPTPSPSTVAPTTTSVPVTTSTPTPTPTPTFSTVAPTTTSLPATTSTPSLTPMPSSSTAPATTTSMPSTTFTPSPTSTPVPSTIAPTTTSTPVPTSTPSITPTSAPFPVLVNNQLTLGDGQTAVLSSTNLQATETGFNPGDLTFYISNVQNGYFSLLPTNASVTRFLQSYVQNGQVQFVHSGDHQAPSYSVVVSDGSQVTVPSPASINFIGAPSITTTPVTVTPGGSTTLTTNNLNVTNTGGSSSNQIVFQVSNVQHGQFVLNSSSASITNFTLTQLSDQNVQLVQDHSNIAPSYSVSVTGNTGLSSAVTPVTAQLCTSLTSSLNCAPVIVRNNLWVKQGASATLTSQNLYATTNNGQSLPENTVFFVMNINHGYFDVNGSSSSFFSQQQLEGAEVRFVNDGSNVAPSYQIAVQSSGLQTNSLAQVTLGFVNKPPYLSGTLPNQIAAIGQPFSLSLAPNTFTDPQGDPLILSAGVYNSTQSLPTWLSFNPSTNRFSGTPTESEVIDIGVTATDPEGLSSEGEFSLTVLGQSSAGFNSLTTAIASSVVSGTIGLFFLLLKICLQRAANKKLDHALGDTGDYEQKVVRPLGRAIAQRLKITGFMGNTTQREMVEFKDGVRTLLGCLSERGINLEDSQMSDSKRAYLIHEIAAQTKEYFLPSNRNCCQKSCRSVVSFFTSEVTPHQISTAAATIADAVVQAQRQHKSSALQLGLISSSQSGVSQPVSPSIQQEEAVAALS